MGSKVRKLCITHGFTLGVNGLSEVTPRVNQSPINSLLQTDLFNKSRSNENGDKEIMSTLGRLRKFPINVLPFKRSGLGVCILTLIYLFVFFCFFHLLLEQSIHVLTLRQWSDVSFHHFFVYHVLCK